MVNAVKAALEEGLRVAISATKTCKSRITGKYLRKLLGDYADKVVIIEDFISPTGRASTLLDETSKKLPPIGGYAYAGSEISIHPNGDVAFCCGHIITDPISAWFTRVGNITREHLWDRRRQNSEERVDLVHQVYKPPRLGQKIQRKRGGEAHLPRLPPPRHEVLEGARDTRQRMDNKRFKERSQEAQCTSIG